MGRLLSGAALAAFFTALLVGTASAEQVSQRFDYLVQEVCADSTGTALPVDPYDCPRGNTLRPLKIGEPLPYHKHDQPDATHPEGYQQHDSYLARALRGDLLVINPFVFGPFDRFKPWTDGYDIFVVNNGWVSASETKDGGGFSSTFFGTNCTPYNGWIYFPASALGTSGIQPGQGFVPIQGVYWEQNGQAWPGECPAKYQLNSLTSWEFLKGFPFGGIGGGPVKRIDAIRSVHGFTTNPQFLQRGHLEVFYFTKLYGITRWEVWSPQQRVDADPQLGKQASAIGNRCGNVHSVTYQGNPFVVTACHDWSAVTVLNVRADPIAWPVPDMNLLRNFHFADELTDWNSSSGSVSASATNSDAPRDTKLTQAGGQGVRYLALSCQTGCTGESAFYQDVPVSAKTTSGKYMFGATARSEGPDAGSLRFTLAQVDGNGKVISEKSFTSNVGPSNGHFTGADSVLLSSDFMSLTTSIAMDPRATTFRFSISPMTPGTFDIVDTWMMKTTY